MSTSAFGTYGGRYVPETLIPALDELEAGWREAQADGSFRAELEELGRTFAGRPTPLTRAEPFAHGKRLYLKREDLVHPGTPKLNNTRAQAPRRDTPQPPRASTKKHPRQKKSPRLADKKMGAHPTAPHAKPGNNPRLAAAPPPNPAVP